MTFDLRKLGTVLVSGAAGDIGIGLVRILKDLGIPKVVGCDIYDDNAGPIICDDFFTLPRANDPQYLEKLKRLIEEQKVALFIPSSEAEIAVLVKETHNNKFHNVPTLIINASVSDITLDKARTVDFLNKIGIAAPWTRQVGQEPPKELPCLFKLRQGQGSKGLEIVDKQDRVAELSTSQGAIWQQLLQPDNQEYTCGIFKSRSGEIRTLIMHRELMNGFTGKGKVVFDHEIENYILKIARELDFFGSINFQLRKTPQGPILFEINPRFSSTVVFRHKLGFTDLLWSIEDLFHQPLSPYNAPRAGTTFYRGICEYICDENII